MILGGARKLGWWKEKVLFLSIGYPVSSWAD
jgi:hypothetical protein